MLSVEGLGCPCLAGGVAFGFSSPPKFSKMSVFCESLLLQLKFVDITWDGGSLPPLSAQKSADPGCSANVGCVPPVPAPLLSPSPGRADDGGVSRLWRRIRRSSCGGNPLKVNPSPPSSGNAAEGATGTAEGASGSRGTPPLGMPPLPGGLGPRKEAVVLPMENLEFGNFFG
jgi:hypothetical protein